MLKRIFSISMFQELTLTEHIIHSVLTYGLPMAIAQFFFSTFLPHEPDLLNRIITSFLVGGPSGILLGIIEHGASAAWKRAKSNPDEKGTGPRKQ